MDNEMTTGGTPSPDTAPAPAPGPSVPDTASSSDAASNSANSSPQAEEKHVPDAAIQVDPETGRRRVVFPSSEQAQPTQAQAPQETTPQEPQAPQQYSANDLVQLVATGQQIDPARVPQELQGYAAAIQQQRINAAQAQQMMQMQQSQNVPPQAPPQPTAEQIAQEQKARAAVYEQITQLAEQKACNDLGVTKAQLNDAKFSDDEELQKKAQAFEAAVRFNTNAISQEIMRQRAAQAQQMQAVQRETQETMQAILPKWNEYKQDPHYNDIDNMMGEFYKTLPFEEGAKVKQSIDRFLAGRPVKADVDILDNYYKRTKEAYYAKATGVSTTPQPVQKAKPPRVEQPGQHGTTAPQKVDWTKMRGMTPRQRSQFLQTYLR
ncbi:hypothetical protein [Mitsuokella jalaludinii]|uniref:hypothetical protein n=1 Tax=Mitsuokella jalaludinii TaxID=187979 RepID=UPI0020D0E75C|nr:hypothetical protein [Mitsuokella jalaludinii]MCQ1533572.1 hypothetical protein [Mitsuokella jalaludinii]